MLEHDETCSCLLILFIRELAVIEREKLILLGEKVWHDLDQVVVLVLVDFRLPAHTPIHEDIPFPAMAMHVTEQNDLILLVVRSNKFLRIVNSGVEDFGRIRPSSIQISSHHVTSIIASHYSIRVEHWDYFENECVSQQLRLFVILLKQKFNRTMNHELCVALSRMHARSEKDDLFFLSLSIFAFLNRNIE